MKITKAVEDAFEDMANIPLPDNNPESKKRYQQLLGEAKARFVETCKAEGNIYSDIEEIIWKLDQQ